MIKAMLAEASAESMLPKFCLDEKYFAEQKIDGIRLICHVGEGKWFPSSRAGNVRNVGWKIEQCFAAFKDGDVTWVFDGEFLDGVYNLFDIIQAGDVVVPSMPYELRRQILEGFVDAWKPADCIRLIPVARTTDEKIRLAATIREAGGEGLIFKERSAPYYVGKRSGAMRKIKFRHEVDCIVTKVGTDGKANMTLALVKNGKLVEVAECTALAGDGAKIVVGDIVTVTCLYATNDNRLYQPTLPKIRDDKEMAECTIDQLDVCRPDKSVLSTF